MAPRFRIDMGIARRLTTLAVVGPVLAIGFRVLHGVTPTILDHYEESFMGLFLGLVILDWTVRARPGRKEQISLESAFFAGIFALVVGAVTDGNSAMLVGLFVAMSLTLNALTPCASADRRAARSQASAPKDAPSVRAAPPAAEIEGPRPVGGVFWLLAAAALLFFLRIRLLGIVVLVGFLAFFFFRKRRHSDRRRSAGSAGWATLGVLFALAAVVAALVGGVLDSNLGAQLLKNANVNGITDFMIVGDSGHGLYLFFSVATLLFVPAIICLLMGRRWAGSGHVIRGALGLVALAALVWIVAVFLSSSPIVLERDNLVLRKISPGEWQILIVSTGILGIFSAVTLAWPGADRARAEPKS